MRTIVNKMPENPLKCKYCRKGYCFFNDEYCLLTYGKPCIYLEALEQPVKDDCK